MAEDGGKDKRPDENTDAQDQDFVRERVLGKRENRKASIKKAVTLVVCAVIFGAVACLTFVLLKAPFETLVADTSDETIEVPSDEETAASTTAAAESSELDIESAVVDAVEAYDWDTDDYAGIYSALADKAEEYNKAIVTVTTRVSGTDMFDNTIETEGNVSGVVWNITDSEALILTAYEVSDDEVTVEVTFESGDSAAAYIKAADSKTGIAVISVPLDNVDSEVIGSIGCLELGNSNTVSVGDVVIFAGSPANYVGSISYGVVSYVRSSVITADMDVRVLVTDMSSASTATGFLIDLDGKIVGMITSDTTGTNTQAIGISDLKSIIEKLANGYTIAYLGVVGQDVTEQISASNDVPVGIYVTEASIDSPAYNGGIQSGDIITAIDGTEVLTMKQLQAFIAGKLPGDTVTVTVQRTDRSTYSEMTLQVTLGTR